MPQTTIQKAAAVRSGSVKILIGSSFAGLVDIGAIRDPKITPLVESQAIEFDNVSELKTFAKGKRVQVSFTLGEINLTNLAQFDAGWATLSVVAGSATPVVAEAHGTGWTLGQPIKVNNKDGDNTAVQTLVVKAAAATLVLNTDYRVYVGDGTNGELGYTYVVPLTAQAAAITFDYSYTPNASKKLTFADYGSKVLKVCRLVNTDSAGKEFRVDIQNVTNVVAPEIDFASDSEADVATATITLEGDYVEVVDEQQTT